MLSAFVDDVFGSSIIKVVMMLIVLKMVTNTMGLSMNSVIKVPIPITGREIKLVIELAVPRKSVGKRY